MTHNTPDGTHESRRWCENCQLSVAPLTPDEKPVCPACEDRL